MISASGLRCQSEYSLCSAATGCTAWARRMRLRSGLGHSEVLHLACRDQVLDGSGGVFNGHIGVDAVLVVEIDDIDLQSLERAFHGTLDLFRRAIGSLGATSSVGIDIESELGGDDDLFAEGREGLADEFLIGEGAVDLRGVEEGDAALDGGTEKRDHLVLFRERFVGKAQAHATEAEGGYFKIAFSQFAFLH